MSPDTLRDSLGTAADLLAGRLDHVVATLASWARILPGRRRGRGMHARAVLRWHVRGVRGHRLATRRVGARHVVDGRTLREYLATVAAAAEPPAAETPSTVARRRAHRAKAARIAAKRALRRGVR